MLIPNCHLCYIKQYVVDCPCPGKDESRMEDISLKMISPMTRVRHIIPVMPIPLDNVLLSEALVRLRMFEERLYLFSFSM
jgi:hypothetical protein